MKNLARLLAGIIGVGAGPAACIDKQAPELKKSALEVYVEKFPKDYAKYYLRFYPANSCQPADKEAEELYDKVVQSAIRTHTFLGDQGIPKSITRGGWWDMAYVEVARTGSKSNERSTGEGKSIGEDGRNNNVGYTGNYAGDDELSLKSLRLEKVYPSYLDDNKIVRVVQNFNDQEISELNIKSVADLNKFLEHTCRLVSGYDMM